MKIWILRILDEEVDDGSWLHSHYSSQENLDNGIKKLSKELGRELVLDEDIQVDTSETDVYLEL